MRFGVVLCPKCKTAKGIVLGSKTTTCTRCEKRINLKNARIIVEVDSESELAKAVGEINTRENEGENIYLEDVKVYSKVKEQRKEIFEGPEDLYGHIAGKISEINGKDEKIVMVAKELSHNLKEFSENDFLEVLSRAGFTKEDDLHGLLARLLENDIIYEPKNGLYRIIEE
jgi:hypothetical protein